MTELLLGCGSSRVRKIAYRGRTDFDELVTLDFNPDHKPDVVHDLDNTALPFPDNSFDEIHAYDVMEHTGHQGDWRFFFAQFDDIWRVLKPDGAFIAISPTPTSPWAWGDPGHTRIMSRECLIYLDRGAYTQVGISPMTDYRRYYRGDFRIAHSEYTEQGQHIFVLDAIKPARSDDKIAGLAAKAKAQQEAANA